MSEFGFFHADRGYWQAISGDPAELIRTYPEGTVSVPVRPSPDHIWTGTEWQLWVPLEELRSRLHSACAEKRWAVETAGITVGGSRIATDIDSQNRIGNAYAGAQRFPDRPIDFNGVDGWGTLTTATMIAIGDAVYLHVQACFSRQKALDLQISAAPDEATLNAIDINDGWPGQ